MSCNRTDGSTTREEGSRSNRFMPEAHKVMGKHKQNQTAGNRGDDRVAEACNRSDTDRKVESSMRRNS